MDKSEKISWFEQFKIACLKPSQYKRLLNLAKGKVILFLAAITLITTILGYGMDVAGFTVSVGGWKNFILNRLPAFELKDGIINKYVEPFVGGGALLFELSPKNAVINDSNEELMNVYSVLCDEVKFKKMCNVLNHYEKNHSEEFFYDIRNKDRNKNSYERLSDYTKAARTIYLNKACFNGLYRVNKKNEFNVPFGKKNKVNT